MNFEKEFAVEEAPQSVVSNPNSTFADRIAANSGFHNPRSPQVPIATERPEHRAVLLLKMQGLTNIEIEERTGYTRVHIATIVKQPWAQRYMSENMHLAGMDQVICTLKGAALKAAKRLEYEIDNMDARAAERISASKITIQQIYGAAQQTINVKQAEPEEMDDAQIANRIAELQRLQASHS
jgi:hypothetical protein